MTRYVGIDPSTKTGMVMIGEHGHLIYKSEIIPKETSDPERFMDIANQILLNLCKDDVICIEGFSYGSKGQGVSTQYGIGWIVRAELIKNGYTYTEVSPKSLKKFATGNGNEKKENMILPIFKHWGFEHPSNDVRDAYVLSQIAKGMNGISKLTKYQMDVIKKIQEGK